MTSDHDEPTKLLDKASRGEQQAVDQFQNTTDKIVEFMGTTAKEPALLKGSITDLLVKTIAEPTCGASG